MTRPPFLNLETPDPSLPETTPSSTTRGYVPLQTEVMLAFRNHDNCLGTQHTDEVTVVQRAGTELRQDVLGAQLRHLLVIVQL